MSGEFRGMNLKEFLNQGNYFIEEVKKRAEKGSPFFFNPDTMRFFSSRISELSWKIGEDIYFITSETDNNSSYKHSGSVRSFTVRICDKDGDIKTHGNFQGESTLSQARKTIKEILEDFKK